MNLFNERGSVLVEFALVSLVLWLLFAVAIDFGRLMFSAQALQDAARTAAREMAVTPLPSDVTTFEAARDYVDPSTMQPRFFNIACLVIDLDDPVVAPDPEAFVARMPIVNRALRPLMIVDKTADHNLLRYPGALLNDTSPMPQSCVDQAPTLFAVGIPQVQSHDPETIKWIDVIEEVRAGGPETGPFNLANGGLVALRVNYPYQAAALSSFQPNPDGPAEPTIGNPNRVGEGENEGVGLSADSPPTPGEPTQDDPLKPGPYGPYTGPYGLGRQLAFASTVRPYSRVLAGQAIFRREVFLP